MACEYQRCYVRDGGSQQTPCIGFESSEDYVRNEQGRVEDQATGSNEELPSRQDGSTSPIRVLEDEDLGVSVGDACFNPALIAIDTHFISKPMHVTCNYATFKTTTPYVRECLVTCTRNKQKPGYTLGPQTMT